MVNIAFQKFTLPNGLDVIVHEDHSIPSAAVNLWYHVGSKEEQVGRTGFAHLFEHLMFEGSRHHNKSYFEPLQKVGATLNGSTSRDRTNYWENLPSEYLELALWLESDRMGFLLDALDQKRLDIQRDVVKNERRQSFENRPYGMAFGHIQTALFPLPHPYNWWTIGSHEDLEAATLEDVKAFFTKFYGPNNASLAVAGDVKTADVLRLAEKYFGDIKSIAPLTRMNRRESDLGGPVHLSMEDNVMLPRVYLAWPTPPRFHPDDPALTMLATVLTNGKSSRLYRKMVYEKQMAQEVFGFNSGGEIAGQYTLAATAAPGHTLEEVEAELEAELESLRRDPPTDREMARAKNAIEVSHIEQLEKIGGFGGRADQLNFYNVMTGDPGAVNTDLDSFLAVRPEDVQRVASLVLDHRQVRMVVTPQKKYSVSVPTIDRDAMPGPSTAADFTPPVAVRRSLLNGLTLLIVPKHEVPFVAVGLVLPTGADADPADKPGLAHMTTALLDEGTTSRTSQQLAEELEFLGAEIHIRAERELTTITSSALAKHWTRVLELAADVVLHPTFPEEEVARIRKQHLTDLARSKDDPTQIAERLYPGLLYGATSPYGHPSSGTEESVVRITREDMVRHFQSHFGPRNAALLVVGDVTVEEVMAQAQAKFGGWTTAVSPTVPAAANGKAVGAMHPTRLYMVNKPGAAQSVIRAGHISVPRHHPDFMPLQLLNYAFGGHFAARLNMNLRQAKGYSYGYHSYVVWHKGPSYLAAGGGVQSAVTKESVLETIREFEDLRAGRPITVAELEATRDGLLRSLPSTFETAEEVLGHLIQIVHFDLPDDYYSTLPTRIRAVTLEDIHRASEQHVMNGGLSLLVVGDQEKIEKGLKELGLPIVALDAEGERVQPTPA
ncbi:MAG: insulinase family protein [Dehalococcoidia bacterium]|nr:insulinase family protein [Dehalococcoidia bacterium]